MYLDFRGFVLERHLRRRARQSQRLRAATHEDAARPVGKAPPPRHPKPRTLIPPPTPCNEWVRTHTPKTRNVPAGRRPKPGWFREAPSPAREALSTTACGLVEGLGLKAWGVGCRWGGLGRGVGIEGLGCRVQGLGCRWGLGFGVWGLGFGVWGLGLGFGVRSLGLRVLGFWGVGIGRWGSRS